MFQQDSRWDWSHFEGFLTHMSGGDAGIQLELHVGCQLEYPPVTSPHGLLAASQRGSWVLRGSLPEKPRRIYIVFYDLA